MITDYKAYDKWLAKNHLTREHLPHISIPLYQWAFDYIMTDNRIAMICGANQISKSSTVIRKNVFFATRPDMWKRYFPHRRPNLFWYFYPSKDVLLEEWATKWEEWMPRIPKGHRLEKQFGWDVQYKEKGIPAAVTFNTGVRLGFRYYEQRTDNLQASTLDMVSCDEEPPEKHIGEIMARLTNTRGIFNSAFTATKGQALWHRALERINCSDEVYPHAFKRLVSLYDCLEYCNSDAPTPWTVERIEEEKKKYHDDLEIKKRIYGRFIPSAGKAFYAYDPKKVRIPTHTHLVSDRVFGVVDPGSGGRAHPAGVMVLSQRGDGGPVTVLSAWRGDNKETTSNDILRQYNLMTQGLIVKTLIYDYAARDFFLTASRELEGVELIEANKKRDLGFERVNSYLEAGALLMPESRPGGITWWEKSGMEKLHEELFTVLQVEGTGKKTGMVDDLTDCLRYACMTIDVNLSLLAREGKQRAKKRKILTVGRHQFFEDELEQGENDDEMEFWAQQYI